MKSALVGKVLLRWSVFDKEKMRNKGEGKASHPRIRTLYEPQSSAYDSFRVCRCMLISASTARSIECPGRTERLKPSRKPSPPTRTTLSDNLQPFQLDGPGSDRQSCARPTVAPGHGRLSIVEGGIEKNIISEVRVLRCSNTKALLSQTERYFVECGLSSSRKQSRT